MEIPTKGRTLSTGNHIKIIQQMKRKSPEKQKNKLERENHNNTSAHKMNQAFTK